ncbi:hypothetical protein LIER_43532 [Lithospermum erythrorhizon]|uniref:Uncharacterized protein n=1 Tax=Lithospermum erythrorhizon TaxID=34254 RepID=A0AAV3QEG5_LITER
MLKFSTRHGTGEIQGSQKKAHGCYLALTKRTKAQMTVGSTPRGPEGPRNGNVCTLEVGLIPTTQPGISGQGKWEEDRLEGNWKGYEAVVPFYGYKEEKEH